MTFKKTAIAFTTVFAITLLVTIAVTLLWNLVFHGSPIIDWETSFRLAFILGIILPIVNPIRK